MTPQHNKFKKGCLVILGPNRFLLLLNDSKWSTDPFERGWRGMVYDFELSHARGATFYQKYYDSYEVIETDE